jgi:Protein of unknown function (DUF2911)
MRIKPNSVLSSIIYMVALRQIKPCAFAIVFILSGFNLTAQDGEFAYPSLSPKGIISQTIGNTLINVEYERPSARSRVIYGGLVPWNKVWRTGAGHCTKISFDKDVIVGNQPVPAGKYSLFTIPNPEAWVIIINRDTTLYGSFKYNIDDDVARFTAVPAISGRFYETLNIDIESHDNNAKMYISWTNTQVGFDITTSTNEDIEKRIETELFTRINKVPYNYAGASAYYFNRNGNYDKALSLADMAIELDNNYEWPWYLKMKIYEKMGQYDDVIKVMDQTLIMLDNLSEDRTKEISQLRLERQRIRKLQE